MGNMLINKFVPAVEVSILQLVAGAVLLVPGLALKKGMQEIIEGTKQLFLLPFLPVFSVNYICLRCIFLFSLSGFLLQLCHRASRQGCRIYYASHLFLTTDKHNLFNFGVQMC